MVGEHGPEVVRLPFGSDVFPSGASIYPHGSSGAGGGDTIVNVNVNVSGIMDLRTQRELTQTVSAGIKALVGPAISRPVTCSFTPIIMAL